MASRVIGFVKPRKRKRDEPTTPVPVVMHDDEPMPHRLEQLAITATHPLDCDGCYTPPEITAARASLPAHRPTNRDWFKINGGDHARV